MKTLTLLLLTVALSSAQDLTQTSVPGDLEITNVGAPFPAFFTVQAKLDGSLSAAGMRGAWSVSADGFLTIDLRIDVPNSVVFSATLHAVLHESNASPLLAVSTPNGATLTTVSLSGFKNIANPNNPNDYTRGGYWTFGPPVITPVGGVLLLQKLD